MMMIMFSQCSGVLYIIYFMLKQIFGDTNGADINYFYIST